jgi:hypothetical protein
MKGTLIKATLVLSVVTLTACSSTTTLKVENTKVKQVPTWYLNHADARNESKAWYTPWDKEGFYYAVAEDVSPSMELALKKATLKAKAKVADRINGELNNRTTIIYNEKGSLESPTGSATSQDVIVNLISETIVRTYGIDKKEVIYNPELRNYRAFVLMKISQKDVQGMAARYDNNKALKAERKVAGQSLEETTKEVLSQTRQ